MEGAGWTERCRDIGDARSLAIHPATTTHSQLSPENQLAELRADSQRAKGHHIGATFHNHVKQIGLLRTARRAGTWYAPNDAFLEALVLANVTTPMEFGDFLDLIMRRYNIVVGPEESGVAVMGGVFVLFGGGGEVSTAVNGRVARFRRPKLRKRQPITAVASARM